MGSEHIGRIALLWNGDREARHKATPQNNRLSRVFEALAELGIAAEPAVYADEIAENVREQLLGVDGVLVWVNPIAEGQDRSRLDALLREVASHGVWVSAHPDVILKMGTKEVLVATRDLGWGTDCHLYKTPRELREQLPQRLASGARVLKQYRGNGGNGVWKVTLIRETPQSGGPARAGVPGPDAVVEIQHALRGSAPERMRLDDFMARCEAYFAGVGRMVDQAFQERLPEGMIRCYVVKDKVVGFGHQLIKALVPPPAEGPDSEAAQPGPRIMHGASAPAFQALRRQLESEWIPAMQRLLDIGIDSLPAIWDADFLYGPKTDDGEDTYVLCEINVSAVFPFPDQAIAKLAQTAATSMLSAKQSRALKFRPG